MSDQIFLSPSPIDSQPALAELKFQNNTCEVHSLNEPLWNLVRTPKDSIQAKGYILSQGDILKFGRVKYIIRELRGNPLEENTIAHEVEVDRSGNSCKICLSDHVETGNPMVAPCRCAGTMKYIHVECLQMCVMSQMSVNTSENCKSYTWKSMHCSLCSERFPYSIRAEGVEFDILAIERPEAPYFIIEGLSQHGNNRGMHSASLKECNSVMLGRGHDSQIRIGDISVSRCHARIKYFQGQFVLEDNNSKFGTLVQVNSVDLTKGETISLQSGRSYLQFTLKDKEIDV